MKYMIHTCNKRRWYVNKYLIPSMLDQGIQKDEICVAVDTANEGILLATMKMFDYVGRTEDWDKGVWHLQDDVVLSNTFKQRTDELYGKIICGFCSRYDESKRFGLVDTKEMWYSFPCIYINNKIAKDCADWFFQFAVYRNEYKEMIEQKKYADFMFKKFLKMYHADLKCFNVNPNLVDHIDYLIGGSVANSNRDIKQVRAYYWKEQSVIQQLQQVLQNER